jgi:choline-sulfatase
MDFRRDFQLALLLSVALIGLLRPAADLTAAEAQPNVLFIFADDQMYNTIQALGNDEVETPNLDRLARRGVTFTHAYNQGSWSGAVCVASRTMLNTGRFLWHANDVYKTSEEERSEGRWWSEYMKQAGYDTYMTGKWHVRADAEKAFDTAAHVRPGMPKQTPQGYNRPIVGQEDPWDPSDPKFGGYWEGGKHWSEIVGDDAETFLAQAAGEDSPFFMYLAFNAPHDPRQSPKEYVDRYPLDKIAVPPSFLPEYPFKDAIGCGARLRDEKLAPFPRTHYAVKVNRQEYYAIITHMDVQIGRILDALEKTGKADSTYIFFSADHGLAVGHHGLIGKQNLFDHSVRVPLIVAGPDVPHNEKIDGAVYLQDIMPSTLELAGVDRPEHVQFKSLMPVIAGGRTENYDSVYGAYLALQRSVTKDGFKLILYPKIQKALLFDLENDPQEMSNLADVAEYQPVVRKLFAEFLELQEQTGDSMDLRSTFPEL